MIQLSLSDPMKYRLALIIPLLLVLYLLFIFYSDNYEVNAPNPSIKTIVSNYPQGEMVSVNGDVISVYKGGFYLKDSYKGQTIIFKVKSSSDVVVTDKVSVLGKLGPSYSIDAAKVLIHKKWKEDFLLVRSAFAGLFMVIIFLIYWKFDFRNFEFKRRREK